MTEIWKQIPDFEFYYISNFGNVKSIRFNKEKLMAFTTNHNGYKKVTLKINSKIKTFRIHRLVAEAFIPNPDNKPTVNHKDKNKENNHATNLEWNTSLENTTHKIETIRNNEKLFNGLCEKCKAIINQLLNE